MRLSSDEERVLLDYSAAESKEEKLALEPQVKGVIQARLIVPNFGREFPFVFDEHAGLSVVCFDRESFEIIHSREGLERGLSEAEMEEEERAKLGDKGYFLPYGFSANQYDGGSTIVSRHIALGELVETLLHESQHEFAFKETLTHAHYEDPATPEAWQRGGDDLDAEPLSR